MKITQLASTSNLRLAWRRITTGGNQRYKRLFRSLYLAYEIALEKNLGDLRSRLLGGAFVPRQPERIYYPKSSGLHRPLSLLYLEDQIVLQAFANLAAKRVYTRRAPLQFKSVFSNILQKDDSIFFFRRWQETYASFQQRIHGLYQKGLRWVGDFDLAAFYDTVSHDLLLKTIFPRKPIDHDMEWLRRCLGTWSSENAASQHGHGIPQGPIASDFLAECFLLPIDETLQKAPGYVRYVDDVRLFGKTEEDVRLLIIQLERRCREHGLIPQAGKFAVKRARSAREAMGNLPSIADPQRSADPQRPPLARDSARSLLKSSLEGRPRRVQDKTRLRHVLFRAEPDAEIVETVRRLVPHHPEHADVFFTYLGKCGPRRSIVDLCVETVTWSSYSYVRGEAWLVLSTHLRTAAAAIGATLRRRLIGKAVELAKKRRPANFFETLAACHFLATAATIEHKGYSRFLKYQPALLQALVADVLPDSAFGPREAAEAYLRAKEFEPGLAVCSRIHALGLKIATFGLTSAGLRSQVRNTMQELGTLSTASRAVDPLAELLHRRFGLPTNKSWHRLLGTEYVHALGILKQADAAFDANRSHWLVNQNSFHDAIFRALQRHLAARGHPAACTTVGQDGRLVDFGVMLDTNGSFSKNAVAVAGCLRDINTRRNQLPVSHPYDKKTAKKSKYLSRQERDRLVEGLRTALPAFVALMP